jgi:hypothetical protein
MDPYFLPAAVYTCIIPVEESLITPSAIYHSPLEDESGGVPQKLPFPAYPEIRKSSQPLCFPTLRAVYLSLHSSTLSSEAVQDATEQYLTQHPDISDPTLKEQIIAANNMHVRAWQEFIETGKFPQEYSMPAFIDSYSAPLNKSMREMGYFAGGKAGLTIWHSNIYGLLPGFYSASDAFAYAHEHAHRIAMWLYSGVILSAQAEHIHYALGILMENPEISPDEVTQTWKFFEQAHSNLIYLAQKFEPIEEIFAVYVGMLFLPSSVREAITDDIQQALKKKNWYEAYETFAKACDACQVNTPFGAALLISELTCRLLEHIGTSATSMVEAVTAYNKIGWEIIKKEEEETLTQGEKDALEESMIETLEHAGVPLEVIGLIHESGMPNLERVSDAIEHDFSRPEDKDVLPPAIMLIGRLSRHEVTPFIYPKPTESTPYDYRDILLDSMRQQLARFFAIARQQLTLPCNLVCPFAFKRKLCCGAKEKLSMLYNRLPEEVRAQVLPPNCDLIR